MCRKCEDGLREDYRLRSPHLAEALIGSVRNIRIGPDSYSVRKITVQAAVDIHHLFVSYRELAFQISEQFAVLGAPLNLRTAVIVGGIDMMAQALELGNRPHVVVATPGRIVDLLKSTSGEWDLSRVKCLVWFTGSGLSACTYNRSLGPR